MKVSLECLFLIKFTVLFKVLMIALGFLFCFFFVELSFSYSNIRKAGKYIELFISNLFTSVKICLDRRRILMIWKSPIWINL